MYMSGARAEKKEEPGEEDKMWRSVHKMGRGPCQVRKEMTSFGRDRPDEVEWRRTEGV